MLSSELLKLTIIGESRPMVRTRKLIKKVADYRTPVLIKGETGTGKELVARGIHYSGDRSDAPFVPLNCGAFNDELFLSELFGHEKGAFTDAKREKIGLLEQADGGTLFLDEIDSLSFKAQVSLLRFMQENEYRPVGSERIKKADVRVVSATNKNLNTQIDQGTFREDLFYRLDVLSIEVPSLRSRGGDVEMLSDYFLEQFSIKYRTDKKKLHKDTLRWFREYSWPGNVRELENYLHRLFILVDDNIIRIPEVKGDPVLIDISGLVTGSDGETKLRPDEIGFFKEEKNRVIESFEREYVHNVLYHCGGNVSLAAKKAGKERRAFGKLIKKYGIDRQKYLQAF